MSSLEVSTMDQGLKRLNFNTPQPQDDQRTPQVTIVDTKNKVVPMLQVLTSLESSPNSVFVDMEGVNLSRHGSISLIQMYVPQCKEIFIVDIHTLGAEAFDIPGPQDKTLKSVLEGGEIKKHFFDVRNDADALYALFNIRLVHVIDVQLLELASRTGSKHVLRGLAACIEQEQALAEAGAYKWKSTKEEGTKLFNPKLGGSYEVFNVRPLPQTLLDYCIGDVQYLPALSDIYQCRINDYWKEQVRVETERRLTESREPNYQPKGKKKIFGPRRWAFPPKSQGKQSVRSTVGQDRPRHLPIKFVREGERVSRGKGNYHSVLVQSDGAASGLAEEQNWALCDKDCGWCGHCGDGVL
ncbi:hypothetical protein D0867_00177 [Hortaea werneckii]|uniref:3'-5' exonuclease domain-containing protein n=1 Tax=Hortaea werneckii TaxID=91943 RepID=A0A3M7AFJ5_HORWE|nr:hypothetical protein D0867_00177 [Hortaea werneckii]RMY42165.1 hypothetical protein D0866_00104 [Hortaea werneckii]